MVRWSEREDTLLRQLIRSGAINPSNLDPTYLFEITQQHFPEFVGVGQSGKDTATQWLRKKFRKYLEESRLRGARRRAAGMFLILCCHYLIIVTFSSESSLLVTLVRGR